MNKKIAAVLTCLAIIACATAFAACTPQNANTHTHDENTKAETSSVLLDDVQVRRMRRRTKQDPNRPLYSGRLDA